MNKSSWTPLKLASVSNPTTADLETVMALAKQNLGRPVEMPLGDGQGYLLAAIIPPDPSGMQRFSYVEWSLSDAGKSHLPPLWSHRTADLAVILGLVLQELASAASAGELAQAASVAAQSQPLSAPSFLQPAGQDGAADVGPAASGTYATFGVNLSGELADIDLFGVLQSVSICKMTGRLEIVEGMSQIEVFFEDGTPIHATMEDALIVTDAAIRKGYEVVLDALMWKAGKFAFTSTLKAKERSVNKRMDAILVEAAALRDQKQELEKRGIDDHAPLFKTMPHLSEAEFETLVRGGVPADLNAQKVLFSQLKQGESMHDFLTRTPMPLTIWMPALFNLCLQGVITTQSRGKQPVVQNSASIDLSITKDAYRELLRPDTEMLPYPLFLFFAQREHQRCSQTRAGYSVVIFEVKQNGLLPQGRYLRRVVRAFNQVRGELDLVGHFQTMEFGLLLPLSNSEKALLLCMAMAKSLAELPPDEESTELHSGQAQEPESSLKITFGIASVPADATDLTSAILFAQKNRQIKPPGRYFDF